MITPRLYNSIIPVFALFSYKKRPLLFIAVHRILPDIPKHVMRLLQAVNLVSRPRRTVNSQGQSDVPPLSYAPTGDPVTTSKIA